MSNGSAGNRFRKTIWIDLDNSPHVPFFAPIIEELEKLGYLVLITARECFQVCELADLHNIRYKRIGRHYGKSRILKFVGLCGRALQLAPTVMSERPDLALSHGSRSQLLLSLVLRVPSAVIFDYEFARGLSLLRPNVMMAPELIGDHPSNGHIMKYPGIKEDVYVPRFRPDTRIRSELGLGENELVAIVRPPANEAHYHNPESETLLKAVFELLVGRADVKVVLLPRNQRQEMAIRKAWPQLFASRKIVVPDHAVDGLNLIWSSDLVISGGGTMNREAAALGVPVYSIFRGKIGVVDRFLASSGRLFLLETVADVQSKIVLKRREPALEPQKGNGQSLQRIVEHIMTILGDLQTTGPEGK